MEGSQPERRDWLRPSSEALLVLPPDVTLFLTTSNVNKIGRGSVSSVSSEDPCCSCSFLTHEGTSPALIPPTPVYPGTGGRRLRVSDTNRLKSRFIRLGQMSIDVGKYRRIHSQLRKSDARHVMYKLTETNHMRLQRKRRRRSCCPVLLCSSPPTRDVGAVMFSPPTKMSYCSSPVQRDDSPVVMSS